MHIPLPILAVVCGAFFLWLTSRIVHLREPLLIVLTVIGAIIFACGTVVAYWLHLGIGRMTSHKPTASFWIIVALVVVLVGYPLSSGPVGCIVSAERWDRLYAPLIWVADRNQTADRLLYGYLQKCGVWAGQQPAAPR